MLTEFKTQYYEVLELIYDQRQMIGFVEYCNWSQQEIADRLKYHRTTVNTIIKFLNEKKYIKTLGRSKYQITDKGKEFISKTKKL